MKYKLILFSPWLLKSPVLGFIGLGLELQLGRTLNPKPCSSNHRPLHFHPHLLPEISYMGKPCLCKAVGNTTL